MCSVHFTDQQYEYDPESGDVTVEWEGTGPNEDEPVSKFMCKTDTGVMESCEYMPETSSLIGVCIKSDGKGFFLRITSTY